MNFAERINVLDTLTNPELIEQTLTDQSATPSELELAYRLRDAIDEIERVVEEITTLTVQTDRDDIAPGEY